MGIHIHTYAGGYMSSFKPPGAIAFLERRSRAWALLLAAGLVACNDATQPATEGARLRTPLVSSVDSAAFLSQRGLRLAASALQAGVAELFSGDRVNIRIVDAECSGVGDVLTISGPVSGTVSTDACFDIGRSLDLGPAPASGALSFILTDPRFGSGPFRVSGTYPNYTVECEDGFGDLDFNDNILSVVVTPDLCNLFGSNPTGDAPLDDPAVQQELKHLWGHSDPTNPEQHKRFEQGGYIVNRNGQREVVEFASNSSPSVCSATVTGQEITAIQQSGGTIEGFVHTHPHTPGTPVPDPSCPNYGNPNFHMGDGVSIRDEEIMDASPFPGYVMDQKHMHRMDPFHQVNDPVSTFNRDSSCAKG
jgi:hypothetical protein